MGGSGRVGKAAKTKTATQKAHRVAAADIAGTKRDFHFDGFIGSDVCRGSCPDFSTSRLGKTLAIRLPPLGWRRS